MSVRIIYSRPELNRSFNEFQVRIDDDTMKETACDVAVGLAYDGLKLKSVMVGPSDDDCVVYEPSYFSDYGLVALLVSATNKPKETKTKALWHREASATIPVTMFKVVSDDITLNHNVQSTKVQGKNVMWCGSVSLPDSDFSGFTHTLYLAVEGFPDDIDVNQLIEGMGNPYASISAVYHEASDGDAAVALVTQTMSFFGD